MTAIEEFAIDYVRAKEKEEAAQKAYVKSCQKVIQPDNAWELSKAWHASRKETEAAYSRLAKAVNEFITI
jgi:hypothetical protein